MRGVAPPFHFERTAAGIAIRHLQQREAWIAKLAAVNIDEGLLADASPETRELVDYLRGELARGDRAPEPGSPEARRQESVFSSLSSVKTRLENQNALEQQARARATAAGVNQPATTDLPTPSRSLYESGQRPGEQQQVPDDIKKKAKRAIREATGKKAYVPESREGTTMLGVHLKKDVADDFKLIATLQRTTAAKILGRFVGQYVEMHKSPQQVQDALRDHVQHLSGDRDTPIARTLRALAKPKR